MKRFTTEYERDGAAFQGFVDAVDWEHAERIASELNPPQVVSGVLYAIVVAPHWTEDDADMFMKALAECGDEPPDASEFDL